MINGSLNADLNRGVVQLASYATLTCGAVQADDKNPMLSHGQLVQYLSMYVPRTQNALVVQK